MRYTSRWLTRHCPGMFKSFLARRCIEERLTSSSRAIFLMDLTGFVLMRRLTLSTNFLVLTDQGRPHPGFREAVPVSFSFFLILYTALLDINSSVAISVGVRPARSNSGTAKVFFIFYGSKWVVGWRQLPAALRYFTESLKHENLFRYVSLTFTLAVNRV